MGGKQHHRKHRISNAPDDDDEDYEDEEDDVDDREVADLERARAEHGTGRSWTLVSETDESMTYVMELRDPHNIPNVIGSLVRVKSWGLGGEPMMAIHFVPYATLASFDPDQEPDPAYGGLVPEVEGDQEPTP